MRRGAVVFAKKCQVLAIKGPVCAMLMSAEAVRRDLLPAGEKRANLAAGANGRNRQETSRTGKEKQKLMDGRVTESVSNVLWW